MSSGDSVTHWLHELKRGDEAAAQRLWERYFASLVSLARQKLRGQVFGVADEEDVAISAFESFCNGAQAGRFPQLVDRDNLWKLLVVITARKSMRLQRDEHRQKRGGQQQRIELRGDSSSDEAGLDQIVGDEPSPVFAAQVAEACAQLLSALPARDLKSIAIWKMEGYTNDEIAAKLDCAPRTVECKLQIIRELWNRAALPRG